GQALVGEHDLGVDAVAGVVAQPIQRIGPGPVARLVLALEVAGPQAIGTVALGDPPLHALVVGDHAGDPVAVLGLDALGPQRGRLVGVTVGRDHEVLVRGSGARRPRPAGVARGLETPPVLLVDDDAAHLHAAHAVLQWTRVYGGWASSCGSKAAVTGAPIRT